MTEAGAKTWQAVNGAWARTGAGEVTAEAGPGVNPMLVTDLGTGDVDVRVDTTGSSGEALYFRVQDATNWLRARVARTQDFYIDREFTVAYREWEVNHYHTEKQWQDRLVKWEYSKTTYTWSAWHTFAQSSCQVSAGDVSLPADTANDQYRTANPVTTGCNAGKKKWDKQSRTRSSSVDYQWIADGATPPAGYTRTTNSQIINVGSPYWGEPHPYTGISFPALVQSRNVLDSTGWQSNNTVTAPDVLTGQTRADPKVLWWTRSASLLTGSADPCPHWQSLGLTVVSCSLTGATRQGDVVGEATRLVLDKSVAGAVTTLASWNVSPSIPGFRVTADGSTISVYTGSSTGTFLGSVTENGFASQTRHGCGLGGSGLLTPTYALTYCYLQGLRATPPSGTTPDRPAGVEATPMKDMNAYVKDEDGNAVNTTFYVYDRASLVWSTSTGFQPSDTKASVPAPQPSVLTPGKVYTVLVRSTDGSNQSEWGAGILDNRRVTVSPAPTCSSCTALATPAVMTQPGGNAIGTTPTDIPIVLPGVQASELARVQLTITATGWSAGQAGGISVYDADIGDAGTTLAISSDSPTSRTISADLAISSNGSVTFASDLTGPVRVSVAVTAYLERNPNTILLSPMVEVPRGTDLSSPVQLEALYQARTELAPVEASLDPNLSEADYEQTIKAAETDAFDIWNASIQSALAQRGTGQVNGTCALIWVQLSNYPGDNLGQVKGRVTFHSDTGGYLLVTQFHVWDTAAFDFSEWTWYGGGSGETSRPYQSSRILDVGENGHYGASFDADGYVNEGVDSNFCFTLWPAKTDNVWIQ